MLNWRRKERSTFTEILHVLCTDNLYLFILYFMHNDNYLQWWTRVRHIPLFFILKDQFLALFESFNFNVPFLINFQWYSAFLSIFNQRLVTAHMSQLDFHNLDEIGQKRVLTFVHHCNSIETTGAVLFSQMCSYENHNW